MSEVLPRGESPSSPDSPRGGAVSRHAGTEGIPTGVSEVLQTTPLREHLRFLLELAGVLGAGVALGVGAVELVQWVLS